MSALKYKTLEDLNDAIEDYFNKCTEDKTPYTVTGLALHLDFMTRQSIYDYANGDIKDEQKSKEYAYTVRKALLRIENYAERHLYSNHSTGAIFALKNRGWSDKKQIEHTAPVIIKREAATEIEIEDDTEQV